MDSGVVTRAELLRRGSVDADIRRALHAGDLTRLRPGWYATRSADPTVVAAVRAGGVLGCVSALAFHGLWTPPGHTDIHIRRSKHAKTLSPHSCQGHGRPRPTPTAVDSIPDALDSAAACIPDDHWIVLCDSALNTARWSLDDLRAQMPNRSRRTEELLLRTDGRAESGTETLVRLRLRAAGYRVGVQPRIRRVGRVDLRVGRLLIECDSVAHHTGADRYRTDRRRDRKALVSRWMTMRCTYEDVMFDWTRRSPTSRPSRAPTVTGSAANIVPVRTGERLCSLGPRPRGRS